MTPEEKELLAKALTLCGRSELIRRIQILERLTQKLGQAEVDWDGYCPRCGYGREP